jgi:hypothetical protein
MLFDISLVYDDVISVFRHPDAKLLFFSFVDICCRTAGLTSFPDYLVLHMRKFVLEEGWVPKKLGKF